MNKKPMIIVGAIFALIIISLIVYLILSLTTDIFKPTSELFQRYLKEDVENIDKITDLSKEQDYINALIQKNYTDKVNGSIRYTNSSGNVEKFDVTSEGITNNSENNSYRKINIKYGENYNIMDIEFLQEKQTYGLLFSNVVRQFVSANINNKDDFTNTFGIDIEVLQNYNIQEIYNLAIKSKADIEKTCINYVSKLNDNSFSKNRTVQITLNNGDIKTAKTAYSLKLSKEQVKELYLEILKTLGIQKEVNRINNEKVQFEEMNIVLYVLDNKTMRATVETANNQIKIDFYENEFDIKYSNITEQELKTLNVVIKRDEQDTSIEYSDSYNNKANIKYNISENACNIKLNIQNDNVKGIETDFNQNIEISNSIIEGIQKKLEEQPNINISQLDSNNKNFALNGLMKRIDAVLLKENNQVNSELLNICLQYNKELENKYQGIQEKRIKDFNNQFLSYRGNDVKKEIIYNLLDLSGRNMEKYEEEGEDIFRIYLSEGKNNIKLAEELKSKIEKSDKQFNLNFEYDSKGKINIVEIRGYDKQ